MTLNWKFAAVVAAMSLSAVAHAEETRCTGKIRGAHDNVMVPSGATCELENARLNGSVKVERNGALIISGRTFVNGSVISEDGGRYVRIVGQSVRVGGNVQIKYNYETSAIQPGATIRGSLQYVENPGALFLTGAFIGSDLQLFQNTGGLTLTENTIRQNMQCKENTPAPVGGGNVAGNKEDQCSGL
jgi:cytoskeletal protein CcmA (bactofilin family)